MIDSSGREIKLERGDVVVVLLKKGGERKTIWIVNDLLEDRIPDYVNLASTDVHNERRRAIFFYEIREVKRIDHIHLREMSDTPRADDIIMWFNRLKRYGVI